MARTYNIDEDEFECYEPPYKVEQRNDFHIKNYDDSLPPETVICLKCNSDTFMVGRDMYYTAIKCVKCGWELPIHEG